MKRRTPAALPSREDGSLVGWRAAAPADRHFGTLQQVGRLPGAPLGLTHFGQSGGAQGAMWPMLVNIIPHSLACHHRQREGERLAAGTARPGQSSRPGMAAKAPSSSSCSRLRGNSRNNGWKSSPRPLWREPYGGRGPYRGKGPAGQPVGCLHTLPLTVRVYPKTHKMAHNTASGHLVSPAPLQAHSPSPSRCSGFISIVPPWPPRWRGRFNSKGWIACC